MSWNVEGIHPEQSLLSPVFVGCHRQIQDESPETSTNMIIVGSNFCSRFRYSDKEEGREEDIAVTTSTCHPLVEHQARSIESRFILTCISSLDETKTEKSFSLALKGEKRSFGAKS
jgi:hypothetical protein